MNIFISYSSKNRDLIKVLADDLSALDYVVWFDRELIGGSDWWSDILAQIRRCDLFVFGLTPDSLASGPSRLEYQYAHALQKWILPVMLVEVNVRVLPTALQRLQFVDYRIADKDQFKALRKAVIKLPPAQPLPDPLPPEPEVPISPLGTIRDLVDMIALSDAEQNLLLQNFKTELENPDSAADAREWLLEYRKHPNLPASVGEGIDKLLSE